ncbi:MAG TPA: hypothetical protein VHG91_09665, partial [Longimicrobium sp.]|nr:hypothetical protein [Longimicrobium sp.]
MDGAPSFAEAIREVVARLRAEAPSHTLLNQAAVGIDHLGRRLHGLGYLRGHEIGACFTAAVGELGAAHVLPEAPRAPGRRAPGGRAGARR